MSGSAAMTDKPLEIINGSIRLLGDRILIRPLPWDTATTVIAIRHGRDVRGEVLAVGPGRHPFKYKGKTDDGKHMRVVEGKYFQRTEVKVGDVVELGGLGTFGGEGYKFDEILYNGERCLICTERDVALIRSAA